MQEWIGHVKRMTADRIPKVNTLLLTQGKTLFRQAKEKLVRYGL